MSIRPPKEKTNKFLEITDPKKSVGLWSYYAVRETAMTPVGNTKLALGRFMQEDVARWEHREEMGAAMSAARDAAQGSGKREAGSAGKRKFKSPARIIAEYREKCDQDKKRLSLSDWRTKYRWLFLWQNYAVRLSAPAVVAAEPDVQMFFNAPCSGLNCNEPNLHSGRVFFLRKEKAKSESEEARTFIYFVAVVLKPGGTKWWGQIDKTNVTWTDQVYDRLVIDPRGELTWSPILAEVINERVLEKDICLFMLEDDALFKAITDNGLNPHEKYAHLCTNFEFFCRNAVGENRSFYMRWSVFFNPRKAKFDYDSKRRPRVVEVMGERKKGWISRRIEVKDVSCAEPRPATYANGRRKPVAKSREDAVTLSTSDAKLGLGDTPLDRYVQDVAQWVAANNGCAVMPVGVSREVRLALSHALFFVTFPDRRPDEPGGILRGYQLPGRLVEHAPGIVRADVGEKLKERMVRLSEDATARRRKDVVDCLFARACAAVLMRNRERRCLVSGAWCSVREDTVASILESVDGRAVIEKAAWQRGFMEGNALMLFKPGPTAGNLKLPDLSLALCFESKLGLKAETASATDLLMQTAPIRPLKESQGELRDTVSGVYPCRSMWTPGPGKEKEAVAYPAESVRILRDEGRYLLLAIPRYAQYRFDRDLAFQEECDGRTVPVCAYSFRSVGGVRSRADSSVVEETLDINKVTQLARDGRLFLYSIDFGPDTWLADIVFSKANRQPCKIVPTIPLLAPEGSEKKAALEEGRKGGTNIVTKVAATSEAAQAFITFAFNPAVPRDGRKFEGRSWTAYCDAFPAEAGRHVVRLGECSIEGLRAALQEVIATDGVLLTDKEHLDEALRAATYVIPAPSTQHQAPSTNYAGLNLKDRIFYGEARTAVVDDKRRENKGRPLCEVLSPELAKTAEAEFTRQIEADTLVDAKAPKTFKLAEPIRVGDAFREAVAREFRRIAYTGTMGWRQKLNRPAHEVALGIWLASLSADGKKR